MLHLSRFRLQLYPQHAAGNILPGWRKSALSVGGQRPVSSHAPGVPYGRARWQLLIRQHGTGWRRVACSTRPQRDVEGPQPRRERIRKLRLKIHLSEAIHTCWKRLYSSVKASKAKLSLTCELLGGEGGRGCFRCRQFKGKIRNLMAIEPGAVVPTVLRELCSAP